MTIISLLLLRFSLKKKAMVNIQFLSLFFVKRPICLDYQCIYIQIVYI